MNYKIIFNIWLLFLAGIQVYGNEKNNSDEKEDMKPNERLEVATFGSGCFWCTEAVFERLEGVEKVTSGYSGGRVKNPSYKEVTSGRTGHAEVCQIMFDPAKISYEELLDVFWHTHDPTTLNRQGNDIGTQYRSVIFYHSDNQKEAATRSRKELGNSGTFKNQIVTEITAFEEFYKAEDYHQDYFESNPAQPYCSFVVRPKVEKFKARYQDKLK